MQTRIHQQGNLSVEIKYFEAVFGQSELRQYTVEAAGVRLSRKWRAKFAETVLPILQNLSGSFGIEISKPEDLSALLPLAEKLLLSALDDVFDLLVLYCPSMEADREWIEANATDRQVVEAFAGVLQLAIPFEMDNLMSRLSGLKARTTGSNSQSQSGTTSPEEMR